MSSVSSVPPSAPSANSAGSPNAHPNAHYADEPLPPEGQQGQSWLQTTVKLVRGLFQMSEDLQARFAKAKDLHHRDPGILWNRSMKDQWLPWAEKDRQKMAYKIYKEIAPLLLAADQLAEAGEAFEAAALLELKYYSNDDIIMMDNDKKFDQASRAYYNVLPLASARCLQQMIKQRVRDGNLRAAAPIQDRLGDLYMDKCDDPGEAIPAWQKAGNWYKNDQAMSTAVGCYKKVAEAYSKIHDYYKAIEAWEWCADNYPNRSSIAKSSQNVTFFFSAGLCHVATADTVAVSRAIPHYVDLDPSFGRTPECRFLFDISKAMEDGDEERYKFLKESFHQIHQLSEVRLSLLAAGLKRLRDAEDNFA